jgi:hypothetical protein
MGVENDHISSFDQIVLDDALNEAKKKGNKEKIKNAHNKSYQKLLNSAIKRGVEYRTEKKQKITTTVLDPIEKINKLGYDIKYDKENQKTKDDLSTPATPSEPADK